MELRKLLSLPDTTFATTAIMPREDATDLEKERGPMFSNEHVDIRLSDIIEENGTTTVLISWYPRGQMEKLKFIIFQYFSNQVQCIEDVEDIIKRTKFTEQQRDILRWLLRKLKDSINTRVEEQIFDCKFAKIKRDLIFHKISLVERRAEKDKSASRKQKTYIIYDKYSGHYKLGKSTDPKKRKGTLLSDRTSLELIAIADKDVETILHRKYKTQRADGEWFKLSKEQVSDIINTYNFKQVSL